MKILANSFLKLSGVVLTTAIFFSCGTNAEEMREREAMAKALADSAPGSIHSDKHGNMMTFQDSERIFVRNADLSFKVKDVKTATFDIERIVKNHQGYVTSSDLQSHINHKTNTRISADSIREDVFYTVNNMMVLRIPNESLDKTLEEIIATADFLDQRKIKAEDVTKQLLSASLSEQRFKSHRERVEKLISKQGKKLNQTVDAENSLLSAQEMADGTRIDALETMHDVNYSTICINMHQRESSTHETYAYALPVDPYQPGFITRLGNAIADGASLLGEIVLVLIKLWPLLVIAITVTLLVKLILKRRKFA